jgi:hypothetical protein
LWRLISLTKHKTTHFNCNIFDFLEDILFKINKIINFQLNLIKNTICIKGEINMENCDYNMQTSVFDADINSCGSAENLEFQLDQFELPTTLEMSAQCAQFEPSPQPGPPPPGEGPIAPPSEVPTVFAPEIRDDFTYEQGIMFSFYNFFQTLYQYASSYARDYGAEDDRFISCTNLMCYIKSIADTRYNGLSGFPAIQRAVSSMVWSFRDTLSSLGVSCP